MAGDGVQQRLIDNAHRSRIENPSEGGPGTLTFFMEPFTSEGLGLLAQQRPDLKSLYLMRTEISDEGFEAINTFRDLEILDVSETSLTAAAVLKIDPRLPIQSLRLAAQQACTASLAHVAQMETVRNLECQAWITRGETLTNPIDEALSHLVGMRGLENLNLGGHPIQGPGLHSLGKMDGLRFLGLTGTSAPAHDLEKLKALTSLETLLMRRTGLDDRALEALAPLQSLKHLDVSGTFITDRAIPTILGFQTLQALGFEHVHVSQTAAERLFELPKLENLEIWLDGVDGEHWHRFIENRPGFHLEA